VYVNGALNSIDRQLSLPTRAHPGWHVLGGLLFIGWVVVLWLMLAGTGGGPGVIKLSSGDLVGLLTDEEEWLGAYSQGRKLGYVRSMISRSGDKIALEQDTVLKIHLGGAKQEIVSRFSAELGVDFALKEFKFRFRSGFLSVQADGRMQKNRLVVRAQLGSEIIRKVLPLGEAPLFDLTVLKLLASRELKAGDRYQMEVFDPQILSNRPVVIEVVGLEIVKVQKEMEPAIHLRRTLAGQPVDTWIDARGVVLQEKTAFGLMLRREDRETATAEPEDSGPAPEVDVTELLRLFAPEPRGTKEEP
jgi:hypothetical protein